MDGILEELSGSRGMLHGELARLAHGLEWVSSGIDLASIAIMLVGSLRLVAIVVLPMPPFAPKTVITVPPAEEAWVTVEPA